MHYNKSIHRYVSGIVIKAPMELVQYLLCVEITQMDQINVAIIIMTGKALNQVQQPQTMTNTKKEATERELCTIVLCIKIYLVVVQ